MMNKDELRELAVWGMRKKLQEIERQLSEYQREFPELFISDTPPVLLKAEQREGGVNVWMPPGAKPTVESGILDALREHGQLQVSGLRKLTRRPNGSISGALNRMLHKGLIQKTDGGWMLAGQAPAAAVREERPRPGQPHHPSTIADRVRQHLAAHPGVKLAPRDIRKALKLGRDKHKTITSALMGMKKHGTVKHYDDGHWEGLNGVRERASAGKANGSAERTAAQDRAAKKAKGTTAKSNGWKQQWYAHLQTHGPQRLHDTSKALGAQPGSLLTSAADWLKRGIIQKLGPGEYAVGPTSPGADFLINNNGNGQQQLGL